MDMESIQKQSKVIYSAKYLLHISLFSTRIAKTYFSLKYTKGKIKLKILIDSKHGLGDCVQIIPMLQIIRDNYPDCYLAVIVRNKASRELLQADFCNN